MGGGGSTKSTTVVNVPPPTPEETRAKAIANLINEANLNQMGYELQDDGSGNLSLVPRELTAEEKSQKEFDAKLQKQIQQRLLGGPVDPETKALVGQTFDAARSKGNQQLEDYVRQIAGARGLDITTDSPIAKELAQGKANLELGLGGAESAALLDSGNRQQLFAQALNEFQNNLQQQAMLNRMQLAESYSQTGLGLGRERTALAGQTTRSSGGGGGNNQLIGAGIGAAGSIAAAMLASSASFF